jgi:hypothetical protein
LPRIVSSILMWVNVKCARQERPPLARDEAVGRRQKHGTTDCYIQGSVTGS